MMQRYFTRAPARASIPIRLNGRVVGEVRGDTFYKSLKPTHFLHSPPAIAFDISTLRDAERAGAQFVEVVDTATGDIYRASTADIWGRGCSLPDYGHGAQWKLALELWGHQSNFTPIQLTLFMEG